MVKLFLKNSNLCDYNSPTSQTDRRTDRRHAIAIPRFYTKVHRAVIKLVVIHKRRKIDITYRLCIGESL